MSEHDKIRELLALAAAGTLTTAEEKQVAEHVRSCTACSNELEAWRPIASELRGLPTPQPSLWLVQATLARAAEKLAEQGEHNRNSLAVIFVVAFAWLLTLASWPVFQFVSGRFGNWLELPFSHTQVGQTWISFATFTALGWLAGGVAAVMLAVRLRGERRLA